MSDTRCATHWRPGVLCDRQITLLANEVNMISPFVSEQVKGQGVISYGLSSYGYDVRLSDEFKIFDRRYAITQEDIRRTANEIAREMRYTTADIPIIDPTEFDDRIFKDVKVDTLVIEPHGFVLARTMETVHIPRDVLVVALSKSTWARCGLIVNVTPLEPGFKGTVTLELSNTTDLPIRVKAGHGICQFLFFRGSEECQISYSDRGGKYMEQLGVTTPRVVR
jgi:dCTP deaminase